MLMSFSPGKRPHVFLDYVLASLLSILSSWNSSDLDVRLPVRTSNFLIFPLLCLWGRLPELYFTTLSLIIHFHYQNFNNSQEFFPLRTWWLPDVSFVGIDALPSVHGPLFLRSLGAAAHTGEEALDGCLGTWGGRHLGRASLWVTGAWKTSLSVCREGILPSPPGVSAPTPHRPPQGPVSSLEPPRLCSQARPALSRGLCFPSLQGPSSLLSALKHVCFSNVFTVIIMDLEWGRLSGPCAQAPRPLPGPNPRRSFPPPTPRLTQPRGACHSRRLGSLNRDPSPPHTLFGWPGGAPSSQLRSCRQGRECGAPSWSLGPAAGGAVPGRVAAAVPSTPRPQPGRSTGRSALFARLSRT